MGWDDVQKSSGKKFESANFLKLTGTMVIRMVDEDAVSRFTHWIPQANEGKGISVTCIPNCPLCKENKIAKASKLPVPYQCSMKHAINVYDYTNGVISILDKGNEFKTALINARATLQEVLDVTLKMNDMDWKITTTKGEGNKFVYQCIPLKPTSASDDILSMERFDILKLTAPKTEEDILKLMTGKKYSEIFPAADSAVIKDDKVDFTA